MANDIISSDVSKLVDQWLEAERNGEKFPVPFDAAWVVAGYARKDSAKRALKNYLIDGQDFILHTVWKNRRGAGSEDFRLTCDAFKELCMLSRSETGKTSRLYFIDAEKKWKLVQKHAPQVAQEIEILQLKAEIAKQEAIKASAEEKALSLRHYVVTALPEAVQQKVLGYTEVKTVEYRDRVIHNDEIVNDGSTVLKWQLCKRYGFLTRGGKPDYKALNNAIEQAKLPSEAFHLSVRLQENNELKRDWLPELDQYIVNEYQRQRYIGE